MLTVRSEIYRRLSQRYLAALPKIITDATPMKSSFPSTDGASQVRCFPGTGRRPKKSLACGATGKGFSSILSKEASCLVP
jgi:hypothetical protein